MKMKFIVLAVSGFLLATSALHASEAVAPLDANQAVARKGLIYNTLTAAQREQVKAYITQRAPQSKALAAKLKQDKLALYSIITANTVDENQLEQATQALQSDASEVIKNHVYLLNFIYNLADSQQQGVIAAQIKAMLQGNYHRIPLQKKAQ